jgi:hypothetical protein
VWVRQGTYSGNFTIARSLSLTGEGRLVSPNAAPALTIAASDVQVAGIAIAGNSHDLVLIHNVERVTLDQVLIEGLGSAKRGVQLGGRHVAVTRSTIRNIYRVGQDSQAIAGWEGDGPYIIEDNYLQAASENILFGGADPSVRGTIPSEIVIRRNTLTKDLAWNGKGYNIKNLLELKSARHVIIEDNLLEHVWREAQEGFAFVITPVNQSGTHVAAAVENVVIRNNVIRDAAAGLNIARNGWVLARLFIQRNLFDTTGVQSPKFMQILGGMDGLYVEQNTIYQHGTSFIYQYDGLVTNFRYTGNLVRVAGEYGICAQGNCNGRLWQQFFPGGVIEGNAVEGFPSPQNLPGNLFLSAGAADPVGYGR